MECVCLFVWVGGSVPVCLCARTSAGKELALGLAATGSGGVEDAVELWGGEAHGGCALARARSRHPREDLRMCVCKRACVCANASLYEGTCREQVPCSVFLFQPIVIRARAGRHLHQEVTKFTTPLPHVRRYMNTLVGIGHVSVLTYSAWLSPKGEEPCLRVAPYMYSHKHTTPTGMYIGTYNTYTHATHTHMYLHTHNTYLLIQPKHIGGEPAGEGRQLRVLVGIGLVRVDVQRLALGEEGQAMPARGPLHRHTHTHMHAHVHAHAHTYPLIQTKDIGGEPAGEGRQLRVLVGIGLVRVDVQRLALFKQGGTIPARGSPVGGRRRGAHRGRS